MLLALDVGNTNIVIGFLDESGIRNIARLETDRDKTAHEYAISLRQVIEFSGIAPEDIDGAILSSVVPPINGALIAAVRMITGIRPLVVGPGMKTGLNIVLDNPAAMGSDLVVGAAAALAIHAPPLIIIDMGTATTMTVIDREARVLGGGHHSRRGHLARGARKRHVAAAAHLARRAEKVHQLRHGRGHALRQCLRHGRHARRHDRAHGGRARRARRRHCDRRPRRLHHPVLPARDHVR